LKKTKLKEDGIKVIKLLKYSTHQNIILPIFRK